MNGYNFNIGSQKYVFTLTHVFLINIYGFDVSKHVYKTLFFNF